MKVVMPKIVMNMSDGQVTKWLCEDGASVKAGDPMMEIETDKLTETVPAPASGIIHISAQPGDIIECGGEVAVIDEA